MIRRKATSIKKGRRERPTLSSYDAAIFDRQVDFFVFVGFAANLYILLFQVDPRCVVQYLNWYHEDLLGEQRLIKTAKSTNDPYIHIIESVMDSDLGRYYCVIANVVGENQCTAYLSMKSGADATISRSASNFAAVLVLALAAASCRMLKNA